MARRPRCRFIGGYPDHWEFVPEEIGDETPVCMTLDEFETIRLLDREGFTQEQAAERMGVSRPTVTAIYESARQKLASALVEGRRLVIGGGNYRLSVPKAGDIPEKGQSIMRIAVPYENGEVFQHFGHAPQFKLYDGVEGRFAQERVVEAYGGGHGALAAFLKGAQTDAVICGGIGGGAIRALQEAGIALYAGVSGSADEAALALLRGELSYDPEAKCAHHGEGHECHHHENEEGHPCHGHRHGEGHGGGGCCHREDGRA